MSDFRESLYERYVSAFKGDLSRMDAASVASYFAWVEHKLGPLLEGLGPEAAFLELGCGPGYMLEFLGGRGFNHVRGLDVSSQQVELATERGCDAEVADVFEYLKGQHDAFDAIIALDFVEHFHKNELLGLVRSIFDALKGGGRLILQTPNGEGLLSGQVVFGDLTHLTIFTPGSLEQLLRQAGFHAFGFFETGPVPKDVKGRLRVLAWRLIRFTANSVRWIETGRPRSLWTENMICYCEKPGS